MPIDGGRASNLELNALTRLLSITSAMAGELELDRLLQSILEGAADLLHADQSHLYRYDPERDSMISWIPVELPDNVLEIEMKRGQGGAGTVLASGQPLMIEDYDSWEGRAAAWPVGLTGPSLHAPVHRRGSLIGDIAVGRKPGEKPFSEADKDLLQLFANAAAIAISNAQTYAEARRSAEEFGKLYETSLDVASELDLDQVLGAILERTTELLSARSANLRVYDPDRDLLVPILPYRQYGPLAQIELAPGEAVSGKAFSRGEPLVVNDYDSWEGRSDQYPSGLFARVMAVPLRRGDQVTGVLAVDRTADKPPFSEQDVRLLSLFANQAVLAIYNAQLYRESQERSREISHLYKTSLDVTAKLELHEVLEAVIERVTDLVEAQQGEVVVYDEARKVVTDFLNRGLPEAVPSDLHVAGEPPVGLDGIVIEQRSPVRIADYDLWAQRVPDMPIGLIGPMIGVPIQHQGRILGSLSLARAGGEPPFSDDDEQRLVLFANQAAVAIQNARQLEELQVLHQKRLEAERIDAQLETARAVQSGLLAPEPPQVSGWDLAVTWKPALQIGGDFYDFIPLPDGQWGIVVGDVADKGIPAAVFMSMVLSMIRSMAADRADPAGVLQNLNRELLSRTRTGSFVSVLYGVLSEGGHKVTYANAGHNPPVVWNASSGEITHFRAGGMVLGVEADPPLATAEIQLGAGDLLVFYTDGVTEAMDPDRTTFELDQLGRVLQRAAPSSARSASDAVETALMDHTQTATQSDDVTLIVMRAAEPPA